MKGKNEFKALANNAEWSEKSIEAYLVKRMEDVGGMALKYSNPNRSGYPDRLCLFPNGIAAFVELKGKDGRVSQLQRIRMMELIEMRFVSLVLRSKEAVDEFIHDMTHDSQGNEI